MQNDTEWIKSILVDDELHPIREAAVENEIFALTRLAHHIAEVKNTPLQLEHLKRLIQHIEMHPDFGQNPFQFMELCKAKADLNVYLFNAGELTEDESVILQRHAYQQYMKMATDLPTDLWNLQEMKVIMDWLFDHEFESLETAQ